MSDLLVDMTVLERLHQALDEASEKLNSLGRELARATARDLGTPRLDEAATNFFERWRYGTDQLGEAAEIVAKQVAEALRVYERVDNDLASVFRSES